MYTKFMQIFSAENISLAKPFAIVTKIYFNSVRFGQMDFVNCNIVQSFNLVNLSLIQWNG